MGSCARQFEDKDVFVNLVDEKPVGGDMAFPVICPSSGKCMVAICCGERFAAAQLFHARLPFVKDGIVKFSSIAPSFPYFHNFIFSQFRIHPGGGVKL